MHLSHSLVLIAAETGSQGDFQVTHPTQATGSENQRRISTGKWFEDHLMIVWLRWLHMWFWEVWIWKTVYSGIDYRSVRADIHSIINNGWAKNHCAKFQHWLIVLAVEDYGMNFNENHLWVVVSEALSTVKSNIFLPNLIFLRLMWSAMGWPRVTGGNLTVYVLKFCCRVI